MVRPKGVAPNPKVFDLLEAITYLLKAGSSRVPVEKIKEMELDIGEKSCWRQTFQYMEGLIDSWEEC